MSVVMTPKLCFISYGLDVMVHDFGQAHHQNGHNCLGAYSAARVTIFNLCLQHSMGVVTYEFGEAQHRQ